jgi:hypothetical protein
MILGALAATALAIAGLASPAAAATLDPLAPCYASAGEAPEQRETIDVHATGFTPSAVLDLYVDGQLVDSGRADVFGETTAKVPAPFQRRGERPFTLVVVERDNPANVASGESRVTSLSVTLRPRDARPSRRVRFRGRGFTAPRPVYGHYLYNGELRRTVRLARRTTAPCGVFRVRRRQIPIANPETGRWLLQVDQQREYAAAPRSNMVHVDITVRETFLDP